MTAGMEQIQWWHQVPLTDGRITPGQVPIYQLEPQYLFSKIDFRAKSVLDIGCWDGYFSFMAEQRGASRVVALDDPEFRWGGMAGFNFLHEHFQSRIQWQQGNVYQLPQETFDIILCYGVLYHLSDPLLAAINCFSRARELVVIEGLMFDDTAPLLKLLEPGKYADDRGVRDFSNVFTMSTGFLTMIAEMHGFALADYQQAESHRGAMLFKAVSQTAPGYLPTCFPIAPK